MSNWPYILFMNIINNVLVYFQFIRQFFFTIIKFNISVSDILGSDY
jgi:hypothetical protein